MLFTRLFRSRRQLLLESLALRQRLSVFKQKHPQPRLALSDKPFWVMLSQLWAGWRRALITAQLNTVVRWHRIGVKLRWTWISGHRANVGRKCVNRELRDFSVLNPDMKDPVRSLQFQYCRRSNVQMRFRRNTPEPAP